MSKYGEELRAEILKRKAMYQNSIERREEHIDNCDFDMDDCFISQHVDQDGIRECDMQIQILDGDGCMAINAIFDEQGNEVPIHFFRNKWGKYACVARGVFANSKDALLKKTGWTEKEIRVPAWTKFCTSGTGMAGVCSGSTEIVRWHTNMKTGEYVGYPE